MHRILGTVEETAGVQKAADKRVCRTLEQVGDELDTVRDEAEVHDAGGMQSVLLRVLHLLVGAVQTCGCGRADPADPRARQVPPLWRRQRRGEGLSHVSSKAQESWMVWIAATCRSPHLGAQAPYPRTVSTKHTSHWLTSCLWNASLARTSGLGALPPLTRLPGEHLYYPPRRHRRSHREWLSWYRDNPFPGPLANRNSSGHSLHDQRR